MTQSRLHKIVSIAVLVIFLFVAFTTVASATKEAKLAEIQKAIKEKGANWTAGETSVSGLSSEEKKRLCGLKFAPKDQKAFQVAAVEEEKIIPVGQPSSFDWRNNGGDWTTSIKDQGSCGSCWAFGALAALEAQIDIAANEPTVNTDLSEQYMLSCSEGDCEGWDLHSTMNFLRDTGTTDDACFSYLADDTIPCGNACPYCGGRMWNITSWGWVDPTETPTIEEVKAYLQYRPLVTGFDVYEDFFGYTGGVYEYVWGDPVGGHCVAIVGWNDTEQCWICKNSWGSGWGENGWFRIKWGECNIEYWSLHSEFDLPKKVISCDAGGTEKDSFVPGDDVYIKALGLSPSTDYNVWIQPNPVGENDALVPENDPSESQESVTTDANGNNLSLRVWPILSEAPATCTEYDIVLDKTGAGENTYNTAVDAIDSATVAGILAPVPELPTFILFSTGLIALAGYVLLTKKRTNRT